MTEDTASPRGEGATAVDAAAAARRHLAALTSRDVLGVTSVEPLEDGWVVEVEVVEQNRVPSSADLIGLYEVEVDLDGALLAYRRTRRYPRGSSEIGNSR